MSSNLQKKLLQFEAQPSPKAWSNIESALEGAAQFPTKLYEFEAEPNPHAWDKIASSLPAPVIPFHIRYKKPLRYSAAAAVLFLLVISATLLINKKASSETASISTTQSSSQNEKIQSASGQSDVAMQSPIATTQNFDPATSNDANNISFTKQKLGVIPSKNIMADNVTPECLIAEVKDKINHLDLNTSDRFMVYCCDGFGKPMKLPKKLYDVVNCGEEDPSCRQNIQCLQEKVSSATLATDFMGVIQIIKQVQENQ